MYVRPASTAPDGADAGPARREPSGALVGEQHDRRGPQPLPDPHRHAEQLTDQERRSHREEIARRLVLQPAESPVAVPQVDAPGQQVRRVELHVELGVERDPTGLLEQVQQDDGGVDEHVARAAHEGRRHGRTRTVVAAPSVTAAASHVDPAKRRAVYILRRYSRPSRPSSVKELHMSDRPALDFEAVWDVASTIPGWLTEEQAKLLFDTARDLSSASAPLLLEIGSHQGKSTVVLASAARRAGGRSSRSTRSSTAASSAARPRDEVRGQPARGRPERRGGAASRVQHPRAADVDAGHRLPLHRWQARLLDARGRPEVGRAPAARSADPRPRLLLLDRRHPRRPRPRAAVPHTSATSAGPARWPCSGSASRPGRTDVGSCARSRGGCATSSSRSCCDCGCAPSPATVRARGAVRPLLTLDHPQSRGLRGAEDVNATRG